MLSQIRSGGVEFFTLSGLILATLVPAASINGIGFAFPDYDTVWKAMDGDLGAHVRGEIKKAGLEVMDKIWDNGFRQTTSSRQADQRAGRLRAGGVPRSSCRRSGPRCSGPSRPLRPGSISARSIRRCKRGSSRARKSDRHHRRREAYEVQKHCSLTNRMWDGFWLFANRRAWEKLPAGYQNHRREKHQCGRVSSAPTSSG